METETAPVESAPVEPVAEMVPSEPTEPDASFTQDEAPAKGPADTSEVLSSPEPSDEPADILHSDEPEGEPVVSDDMQPARDWERELDERTREAEELAKQRDDLESRVNAAEQSRAELEEQNAVLLGEVEALKARLLDETLASVQAELGTQVSEPHMAFVDKSLLVDENGMPNRDAVKHFVELFAVKRFEKSANALHIGAQTNPNMQPNPYEGYGPKGKRLDGRNRFNPFAKKG